MLTQISILFLYNRVFTSNVAWFKYTLYTLGFFTIALNISIFFAIVFSCSPFRYAWEKSISGHCYEVRPLYLAHTVLMFVLDMSIVAAPMPMVWNLHTTPGTKWAVTGLFLLGGLSVLILHPKASRTSLTGVAK